MGKAATSSCKEKEMRRMTMTRTTTKATGRENARKMMTQTTAPARNSSRRLTSEGISKGKRLGQVKQD